MIDDVIGFIVMLVMLAFLLSPFIAGAIATKEQHNLTWAQAVVYMAVLTGVVWLIVTVVTSCAEQPDPQPDDKVMIRIERSNGYNVDGNKW